MFAAAMVAVLSLLAVRNLLVGGTAHFLPIGSGYFTFMAGLNGHSITAEPLAFLGYYVDNALFCLGFLPRVDPAYSLRPHWMLMWAGVALYVAAVLRARRPLGGLQMALLAFVFSFYLPLIVVAQVSNYGFRLLVPGLFVTLGLALNGYALAWAALRRRLRSGPGGEG